MFPLSIGWSQLGISQGNLLKGIDKKTVRRESIESIEPIKRVFNYVLFPVSSNKLFKRKQNGWKLHFIYI